MKVLSSINNDSDIKKLDDKELKLLAEEVRALIIETSKKISLHLSSNLGIVEITIALMKNFDLSNDKLLYDTGHQTYVHKILTGRMDKFHTIRQEGGLTGFINMDESVYDHYSPGHSGNILSIASGLYQSYKKNNKDEKKIKYYNKSNIVAIIGDAAIANGLAFEALNDIAYNKEPIIIVINDNKMSISESVGALSKYISSLKSGKFFHFFERGIRYTLDYNKLYFWLFKTFNWFESKIVPKNLFQNLGFYYIGPVDGNDINKMNKALIRAKWFAKQGPVIVHARTIKGQGNENAMKDKGGFYHSFNHKTLDEQSFGTNATKKVIEWMKQDENIFVINPAMTRSSNCEEIIELFPDRYNDVGIAEEHAISKASGVALSGKKIIVYIYSSFLQRAYDQLLHDCSRMNLGITLLIDRADTSGGDGPSHHGVYDVGFLKTIEHTNIISPRTIQQLNQLIDLSQNNKKEIFCIRYPKWYFNSYIPNSDYLIKKGKWEWFNQHKSNTVIVSYGPYVNKILEEISIKYKIDVVNAVFINCYDEKEIKQVFNQYKKIIVYERIKTNNGLVADFYAYKSKYSLSNEIIEMNYFKKPLNHGSINGLDQRANMSIEDIIKWINK